MKIKGLIFLVFALIYSVNLSAQILKGSSTLFFEQKAHMDAFSPNLPYGAELAFVLEDSTLYRWSRDVSEWAAYTSNKVYVISSAADTSTISTPRMNDIAYVDSTLMFLRDSAAWLLFSGGTPLPDSLVYQSELETTIDTLLSGSGTAGYVPVWDDVRRLADSPMSVSGNVVTVEGAGAALKLTPTTAPINSEGVIYAKDADDRPHYMDGVTDNQLAYTSDLITNNTSTNYLPYWDGDSFESSPAKINSASTVTGVMSVNGHISTGGNPEGSATKAAGLSILRETNGIQDGLNAKPAITINHSFTPSSNKSGYPMVVITDVASNSVTAEPSSHFYLDPDGIGIGGGILNYIKTAVNRPNLFGTYNHIVQGSTVRTENWVVGTANTIQRPGANTTTSGPIGREVIFGVRNNLELTDTKWTVLSNDEWPVEVYGNYNLINGPDLNDTIRSNNLSPGDNLAGRTYGAYTKINTDHRAWGEYIQINTNSSASETYGIFIDVNDNCGTCGTKYAIYSDDGYNLFRDSVQINTLPALASPTSFVTADGSGVLHSAKVVYGALKETTSQSLAGTASYTLLTTLDTTNAGINVSRTDSTITVLSDGNYRIRYNFSIQIAAAGAGTWQVNMLAYNNAATIPETQGSIQVVTSGAETWRQVVSGETITALSAGDVISLRYTATSGPTYTLYPGTITVEKL